MYSALVVYHNKFLVSLKSFRSYRFKAKWCYLLENTLVLNFVNQRTRTQYTLHLTEIILLMNNEISYPLNY